MKTRIYFLMMSIAVVLFIGCSNEEEFSAPNTGLQDPAGKIGFSFPIKKQSITYTAGDGTTVEDNEQLIKSVNIYMFDVTTKKLVKWQSFSDTDIRKNDDRALFDVTGFRGKHIFYAVANADYHISAASLTSIKANGSYTLADFQKVISNNTGSAHLKAEAGKGLLMVGYCEIQDVLKPSDTGEKINLKRRVACFDIINQENETNFKIESIHISKANHAAHLTAEASTAELPTAGNLDPLTYTGTNDGTEKSVFYLWPTTLDKAQTKTVILIEGTFKGLRQIYKITPASDLKIEGNSRYILKVKKEDLNKVDFVIEVNQWQDGGPIDGEQKMAPVVFSELTIPTFSSGGAFSATMDGTNVNYDGSFAQKVSVLKLTATSYQSGATTFEITNLNNTGNVNTGNVATDIKVTAEGAVTYAGAAFVTTYTITIPKQSLPIDRKITIKDVNYSSNKREILIKAVPEYGNGTTKLKPVLVGGIYWAPVNVGATTTDATTLNLASMGYVYQWGRSYASVTKAGTDVLSGDELVGPVSYANATTGTHKNKFITAKDLPFDWLTPQDNTLWSGDNAQAVCPNGWRLPTEAELTIIKNKYLAANFDAIKHRLMVVSDNGFGRLYLPAAGHRNDYSGASLYQGTYGHYWSSSVNSNYAMPLHFNEVNSAMIAYGRAYGYSVRCVLK